MPKQWKRVIKRVGKRARERGGEGDRERVANSERSVDASLLSVGSCRNCCILSGGGCVVACLAYFSAAWPSAWIIDFHCPPKVALSRSLSHTHWTGNSYCCRLAFICQLIPPPTALSLRPSLSLTNTKERQFIRLSVCLFVCLLVASRCLFVCRCRRMQHIFTSAPQLRLLVPPFCIYLSAFLLSWHCFFRLSLISLFSFIPICVCYCVADPNPHCAHSFVFPLSPSLSPFPTLQFVLHFPSHCFPAPPYWHMFWPGRVFRL